MDIAAFVGRAPERGETVSGIRSKTEPGRQGREPGDRRRPARRLVSFVGAVGDDAYGESLRAAFTAADVDISHLRTVDEETGTAHIVVEAARREPHRRRARCERDAHERSRQRIAR